MKKNVRIFALVLTVLVLVGMAFSPTPVAAPAFAVSPPAAVAVALTPEMLIGFASVILSLLFDWLPGLKNWFDKFSDGQKRGLITGLLVIMTGAVFGLSCAGWLQTGWLCNGSGIQDAVYLLILAVAINQGIHSLTKP